MHPRKEKIDGTLFLNQVEPEPVGSEVEIGRQEPHSLATRPGHLQHGGSSENLHRYQPKCDTDDTDERLQTRILKNQEGCVNTLSMECMDFYHRFHHYHYLWH